MQLALLIQVHDKIQSAAITAVGSVNNIIKLKSDLETELNNIMRFETMRTGVLDELQAPENTHVVYPKLHVLIADQQQINKVVQQFHPNEMYHEVYQLVQNLALIQNY